VWSKRSRSLTGLCGTWIAPFDYQVLYIGQMENALPLIKQLGFARLLRKKMKDTTDILNGAAYIDFDGYLNQVEPSRTREWPPFLQEKWSTLTSGLLPEADAGS